MACSSEASVVFPSSVVVNDLNIGRTAIRPSETDPKLIVDSDAVLAFPVALQCLQPVAGRDLQVLQEVSLVQLIQTPPGSGPEVRRAGFGRSLGFRGVEDVLGTSVAE